MLHNTVVLMYRCTITFSYIVSTNHKSRLRIFHYWKVLVVGLDALALDGCSPLVGGRCKLDPGLKAPTTRFQSFMVKMITVLST